MSTIDYTPILLAQLTDLQSRVTNQDTIIASLKADVERLLSRSVSSPTTMRTSVPLQPTPSVDSRGQRMNQRPGRPTGTQNSFIPTRTAVGGPGRSRPMVAPVDKSAHPTMTLSDVLHDNEDVTLQIGTGKDSDGNFTYTTAQATFDGTVLIVNECNLAESLVGMKSSKPGEILYKFIDELKNSGHIKKTFTIAPWRLCFVERDGVRVTLEELRNTVG